MPADSGFGRSLTLGVEEELILVDVRTLTPVPAVEALVPAPEERLKYELFQSLVEITTPVRADAYEALESLQRLRAEVAERCDAEGITFLAAGMHPTGRGDEQEVIDLPRYRKMSEELGDELWRQFVCGVHVHVGMPDADACLAAYEAIVGWLPTILSLSASSPYADGEETGFRSTRATRLAELPDGSVPPVLPTWTAWEERTAGRDYTRIWWDVRPHPRLGTLEVRMPDAQPEVRRTAGLAALVQALSAAGLEERGQPPLDRDAYVRRREEAARSAVALDELAEAAEPAARALGAWPLVEELLTGPPDAERQLALGRRAGLDAVVADLADRSRP